LAESFLIKSTVISHARRLLLADKFRLSLLETHCFTKVFTTLKRIKELEFFDEFTELSLEMRSRLLTRMMELVE
ncbi:hypothetical protein PFISCL1PPCAC_21999, partial [Pristionchus fissidentatus]